MKNVRFVNPQLQFKLYGKEIMAVLKDRLSKGDYILRDDVTQFETSLAKLCHTKYAIGVNSGFDALRLSLEAVGIGKGDEVITVAHTFLASISAIVKVGATPILIDVGPDGNMDASLIEQAITPRAKAIMPVHLNGRVCDMERIMRIAQKHNLAVIEDACQSLSATFKGKQAGSFGLTGCFSFYPFKLLGAFGEAGGIVTNDKKLAERLILLRYHGVDRTPQRRIHTYGWNAVLDNIQAAVLNVKLNHFSTWIKKRQVLAKRYYKGLSSLNQLKLPHFPGKDHTDVYQNYVIQTPKRNALRAHLGRHGIETLVSWPTPLHKNSSLGLMASLPETERLCKQVISLPMYPELADKDVDYVIKTINNFFKS